MSVEELPETIPPVESEAEPEVAVVEETKPKVKKRIIPQPLKAAMGLVLLAAASHGFMEWQNQPGKPHQMVLGGSTITVNDYVFTEPDTSAKKGDDRLSQESVLINEIDPATKQDPQKFADMSQFLLFHNSLFYIDQGSLATFDQPKVENKFHHFRNFGPFEQFGVHLRFQINGKPISYNLGLLAHYNIPQNPNDIYN